MTANEVIAIAKASELYQISPAVKDDTTTLMSFLNLGLLELYKRFQLKTDEAIITLQEAKTIYSLDGTDPNVELGDDFMYLIAAYGDESDSVYSYTDEGLLSINVEDDVYGINTISYNKIQIPLITPGSLVSIIYAAKPTLVTALTLDNQLDIPDTFVDPLVHYIGYRAHASLDSTLQTENNVHYMRFEQACDNARQLGVGVAPDDIEMNRRLDDRGFV